MTVFNASVNKTVLAIGMTGYPTSAAIDSQRDQRPGMTAAFAEHCFP
jgi:hypothetical protein